ncbi:MAG: Lrp/AsnC family transcriptional regulator [Thermaerobacter sp.]|nr:Lrp/AsnC family transcriptional regulator [Thermaerobacter sp.]
MADAQDPQVDAVDRDWLQLIIDNAGIPTHVLAAQLELDDHDVDRRIARLEAIGIIKTYRAVVDPYLYSLYFIEHGPLGTDLGRQHA